MTVIAGKDVPLEDSILRFHLILKQLNLKTKESSWLNPVENIYSVNLFLENCPAIYSNGKGSSVQAARASALGELFERLATHMEFTDYFLGEMNAREDFVHFKDERWSQSKDGQALPEDVLNRELRDFYFPHPTDAVMELSDLQSGKLKKGICSLPFISEKTHQKVYFPINLLDNLYGSNGMSAGNTENEALVQALSEIVERFVKKQIISTGIALPEIPRDFLKRYPISYASWQKLQGANLSTVCYDASLGGRFPVVCAVMFDRVKGTCFASFGAHPIFQVALDRTLTELLQGRSLNDLSHFSEVTLNMEAAADIVNIESHFVDSTGLLPLTMFAQTPNSDFRPIDLKDSSSKEQSAFLLSLIDSLGFEPFIRWYPQLGVPVCRIIVPGMSEIYPQDDLEFNNNNGAVDFIEKILSLPNKTPNQDECALILDEAETCQWDDTANISSLIGLLPDKDDAWSNLKVCEFKCLLSLASNLYDKALEYANFCTDFLQSAANDESYKLFACLRLTLEYINEHGDYADIQNALYTLYGKQTVVKVLRMLNSNDVFFELKASDLNLKGFTLHQELIKTFKIVKNADLNYESI